jgi:hypothetical protein
MSLQLRGAAGLLLTSLLSGCDGLGDPTAEPRAAVAQYCLDCHNDVERVANLTLESLDFDAIAADSQTWEKAIRKLRGGMMPPADGPEPPAGARASLAEWLENEIDTVAASHPNPGRTVPFHRLNRSEYRNAIRDLLGLEIDASDLLPVDDASYGFDNIAGILKVSPTLLERYLSAAERVSHLAIGLPGAIETIDYFRVPDDLSQESRLPGLPFGTRGGTSVSYSFPVDGEYVIAVDLFRDLNEGVPLYAEEQQLEISVDGERVALFRLPAVPERPVENSDDGRVNPGISQLSSRLFLSREDKAVRNRTDQDWRVRVPVLAGQRNVTATFIARTAALDETPRLPFERPFPAGVNIPETRKGAYLKSVEISGPFAVGDAPTASESPSRQRIFICEPAERDPQIEGDCATTILAALARRAYRRPVLDADVQSLLGFYQEGRVNGDFYAGIQLALKRLLVAPEFLFRIEQDPEDLPAATQYALDDFSLASRLSFFLWSSLPDEELLAAAEAGRLQDDAELERQVTRMIADSRADAFVENFAGQWLFLRNLEAIVPVQSNFPDFDDTLRQGLRRETELFFSSILRENRSAQDLLTADHTFVNERVARHYGLPGIKGSHFRRVTLGEDTHRRGLLGHGSILTVTSYPDRTSPVIRGKWILENLLGTPPPDPPADVPGLVATDGAGTELSMRERLAAHRANPSCASCHALMDPLGFAFENFNAIGQYRTLGDAGEKIDAAGVLPSGAEFDGVDQLREALLSSDLFVTTLTEKLMTYATGRGIEHYDMPAVRAIVRDAADSDYRLQVLIMGVVKSAPFRMRTTGG